MKPPAIERSASLLGLALFLGPSAHAQDPSLSLGRPAILRNVGIDQKMGAQTPLDLSFVDESGSPVTLRRYLGKPVILALVYYQCPSLCNLVLNGIVRGVKDLALSPGVDYNVVAVSFDPRETPEMAGAKKRGYMQELAGSRRQASAEPSEGWHFLTADQEASKLLAKTVGFRYIYDSVTNQYAHPAAVMILTPEGRVSRYFYGIDYQPRDLRLGLIEASHDSIGTPVDQVLLYCFHYDPATGKYGLVIMNVLRLGGLLTLAALIGFVMFNLRRDFRAGARRPRII